MLRNSILSIITEIVLEVLTKHDLTEEEMESRDDLLGILQEHIWDVSAQVRSKVFQHWTRLQTQNAIPRNLQPIILQRAVEHLIDKGAIVRKNAAVCVTQFLSHNPFGAQVINYMVYSCTTGLENHVTGFLHFIYKFNI